MFQLEHVACCTVTVPPGEEPGSPLSASSHLVAVEHRKMSPGPAVCLELSKHSSCAPAAPAIMVAVHWTCSSMSVSFFLILESSKLDTVLQMYSYKSQRERNNPNTWPTGYHFADTAHWLMFSILSSPTTLFLSAKFVPSFQLVLLHRAVPSQVWDLASGKC